jgi:hypothetical protein
MRTQAKILARSNFKPYKYIRPKKIPAQQLLYQWTVELPLALKFPRCATCVQWIVLISGQDQVKVIIKIKLLNWFNFMLFAMAPYGVVFQLLALVQWRARVQARYACTQLSSVSHSGSQAEPDWQWIRVCPADFGADLCDCQWPSPGHNEASLQLPRGQLGVNDCICASDGQQFISSNLKLRPTWKFIPWTWNLAVATATSPCAGSRPSSFSWTIVPSDRPARWLWRGRTRRWWSSWKLAPATPNPRHPVAQVPWYRRTYHEICGITWQWYQKLLISERLIMVYMLWFHETYHKILIS